MDEKMKTNKICAVVLLALLCVSAFAILMPKAAATGEEIIGSLYIDDTTFLRCYDYTYETQTGGCPSNDVYDTAHLEATLPSCLNIDDGTLIQARVLKILRVDGNVIANGLEVTIPAEGRYPTHYLSIGRTNGAVWVNDQTIQYHWWGGNTLYFDYDLSWNSICYGYDIWPNYWSPQDIADDISGHRRANHSFEVSCHRIVRSPPNIPTHLHQTRRNL